MPVRDVNLNLSPETSDLPLIATDRMSVNTLDLEGTPLTGLAIRLDVAFQLGNTAVLTPTLDVIVHAGSSTPVASSDPVIARLVSALSIADTSAVQTFQRIIPFVTDKRYIRLEFDVTGVASDSPAWSRVEAYVVGPLGFPWDRSVNFHL